MGMGIPGIPGIGNGGGGIEKFGGGILCGGGGGAAPPSRIRLAYASSPIGASDTDGWAKDTGGS